MSIDEINLTRAKVHNLKSISLKIPKNKLVVITGPSGSGKSSLAFDTIYAEGQRRYIESLSSYSRQFLGQVNPPDVESITGLSPAIAVDQKSTSRNPRSTVGTTTEVFDYLRVLFARVGTPHCPECGKEIQGQTPQKIVKSLMAFPPNTKIQILSPVIRNRKGEFKDELAKFIGMGLSKVRVDGEMLALDTTIKLHKAKYHNIELVIDRILLKDNVEKRLSDSVEYALKLAEGNLVALVGDKDKEHFYSEINSCPDCNISFPEVGPRTFSFNSPLGACEVCNGLGESKNFDPNLLVVDDKLSILEGAIGPLSKNNSFLFQMVKNMAEQEGVDLKKPLNKLPASFQKLLFEGSEKKYRYSFESENSHFEFSKAFPGMNEWLLKKYHESTSDKVRANLEEYMAIQKCEACDGKRLNPFALATLINDTNIMDICDLSLDEAAKFFKDLKLQGEQKIIAEKLIKEVSSRLSFLLDVGLSYLTLNRSAQTLSGGEAQRIRLATQIGSALSGVLYVLDEPSIGLHQRDNQRLIKTLLTLKDLGNTVIVVEHDEETMEAADYLIDMGPGAGVAGGEVVAAGTPTQVKNNKSSMTGKYLSGALSIEVPKKRRNLTQALILKGAEQNNIHKLELKIPLGGLICVTGVSGSGKSTLINEILIPAVRNTLTHGRTHQKSNFTSISKLELVQSVIELDQSPIGRTPRSNPATYTGVFDEIRNLYAETNDAKIRGYRPGRFSFNVKGGRCESCEGDGVKKIEMHFLPDVYVTCTECQGKRYNEQTLAILYRGKNIADIFELNIQEAYEFFINHPRIGRILKTMVDVGLGYMKLGQSATTLSGGEAQRMKLSRELAKRPKGHCLYVLDEPTTGLHFEDIKILLVALNKLIDQEHTIVVIEHNLDVIKTADWVIDLGPEGGNAGGKIVAEGTPEQVVKVAGSHTGKYLKKLLKA